MTLKEAIDAIAARAAERRGRPATYQEKVALELSNALSAAGDFLNKNDTAKGALMGAGAGALGGAGMALAGPGSWKEKKQKMLGNAMTGGLGGAALGGGLGAARQFGSGIRAPGGPPSGESGTGGSFTDPETGKSMQIDPKILQSRPELAQQVHNLQAPSVETRIGQGIGATLGGAANYAPVSTGMGAYIGQHELRNALRNEGSHSIANLSAGLGVKDVAKSIHGGEDTLNAMRNMGNAPQEEMLARAKGPSLLDAIRGRSSVRDSVRNAWHGPDPNAIVGHGAVGDVGHPISGRQLNDVLGAGSTARKVTAAKIPGVTGRNAALMGLAGVADLGRHAYLGHQDDESRRQQLRELMSQVAKETAAQKH